MHSEEDGQAQIDLTHMDRSTFSTWPQRRFIRSTDERASDLYDKHGFLDKDSLAVTLSISDLLHYEAVLVKAPPWTGKTFVSAQLHGCLQADPDATSEDQPFGTFTHLTTFEHHPTGANVEPTWWEEWCRSGSRACWIVDAIDEDAYLGRNQCYAILAVIAKLSLNQRRRLCLQLFCRENEVPSEFRHKLHALYEPRAADVESLLEVRLLVPDREMARDIVGDEGRFERVCDLIERHGLQAIAGTPCVLRTLDELCAEENLTISRIWKQVLRNLLKERRFSRSRDIPEVEPEHIFQAVCRAAAALTLGDAREIAAPESLSPVCTPEDIVTEKSPNWKDFRIGLRSALNTAIFARTTNGFRFAQRHVQEWFTAFALQYFSVARLRGLVVDRDGRPFRQQEGLHDLIKTTTAHDEVKEWLTEIHNGILPPSDAAPWTLGQATAALDRLQQVALAAPYGLSSRRHGGYGYFRVNGLGSEVAKRLSDRTLDLRIRKMLCDVAIDAEMNETVSVARRILQDESEDCLLRLDAAIVLKRIPSKLELGKIESWVAEFQPESKTHRDMKSAIILALLEGGRWTFTDALRHAPEGEDRHGICCLLWRELEEMMSLDDARELVSAFDWTQLRGRDGRPHFNAEGTGSRNHLILTAIRNLASQSEISDRDYDALLPAVVSGVEELWIRGEQRSLVSLFAHDRRARRMLFEYVSQDDPATNRRTGWILWSVLEAEDLDWLIELARQHGQEQRWLWEALFVLCHRQGVSRSDKIKTRRIIREQDPDSFAERDARRQSVLRDQRRRTKQRERRKQREEEKKHELRTLVADVLGNSKISLRNQLHNLSWFCFSKESQRPWNIIGQWKDLTQDLQRGVLDRCQDALAQCKPTKIPKGSSFPQAILLEGAAFVEVTRQQEHTYLSGEQIRKWLPSALFWGMPERVDVLELCLARDKKATEDALHRLIHREVQDEGGWPGTAANLPAELWSEELLDKCLRLITRGRGPVKARCNLLRILALHSPPKVAQIARRWLGRDDPGLPERREMARTALDLLLVVSPDEGVRELRKHFDRDGPNLIEAMQSISDRHGSPSAKVGEWKAETLEQFCDILFDAFPPESDHHYPYGQAFAPSPDYELRNIRHWIPQQLLERSESGDKAALERLAKRHVIIGKRYAQWKAEQEAGEIIGATERRSTDFGRQSQNASIPLRQLIELFDKETYRVVRSDEDLQRVLLEELEEISKSAPQHLSMLYRPLGDEADKSSDAHKKRAKASKARNQRKSLHEEALQAYLFCRLQDRLPIRRLENPDCSVLMPPEREVLAAKNQKQDLKVQAPTVQGSVATVVIEVKWSTNDDLYNNLVDQLGEKYLIGQNLYRGIYAVGLSDGKLKWPRTIKRPRPRREDQPQALMSVLEERAAEFNKRHEGLKIVPFVLDLRRGSMQRYQAHIASQR